MVRLHGNVMTTSHLARLLEPCEDVVHCFECDRVRPGAHIGCDYLWSEIAVVVHIQDRPARVLMKHPARRARTIGKQGQQGNSQQLSMTEACPTPTNPCNMAVGHASVVQERTWRSARAVRPAPTERTLANWKSRTSAKKRVIQKISASRYTRCSVSFVAALVCIVTGRLAKDERRRRRFRNTVRSPQK